MAQFDDFKTNGAVEEGEKEPFDLETQLKEYHFTDYNKLSAAIKNGKLSLNDLLCSTEADLVDICKYYDIKLGQRTRFINGIRNLPDSKINPSNVSVINSNDKSSHKVVLLSPQEQQNIDKLAKMTNETQTYIDGLQQIFKANATCVTALKNDATALFLQVRSHIDKLEKNMMQQVNFMCYRYIYYNQSDI